MQSLVSRPRREAKEASSGQFVAARAEAMVGKRWLGFLWVVMSFLQAAGRSFVCGVAWRGSWRSSVRRSERERLAWVSGWWVGLFRFVTGGQNIAGLLLAL